MIDAVTCNNEIQEMENERDMEKTYSVLHKKLEKLESQIDPIVLDSYITEPTSFYNTIPEQINHEFDFINKLITAEMALSMAQDSDKTKTHHLNQIIRKVRRLQNTCCAWQNARSTSLRPESSEPLLYSYSDSYEGHDQERSELHNYDDHGKHERSSMEGFKVYVNPEFVDHEDDQDGEVEFEGADDYGEYSEGQEEDETVRDDSETETEEELIIDDQNEVVEFEGDKVEETVRVCDRKEEKTVTAETSSEITITKSMSSY